MSTREASNGVIFKKKKKFFLKLGNCWIKLISSDNQIMSGHKPSVPFQMKSISLFFSPSSANICGNLISTAYSTMIFKGHFLATGGQTLRKTEMFAGFSPCQRCEIVIMRSLGTHNCTSVFYFIFQECSYVLCILMPFHRIL